MGEGCSCPLSGRVASLTRRGKSRRRMVRVVRRLILALMAGIAVCRCPRVLSPNMATRAGDARMRPRQGERGLGMVKTRRYPARSAMADLAILRKSRTLMIWIC